MKKSLIASLLFLSMIFSLVSCAKTPAATVDHTAESAESTLPADSAETSADLPQRSVLSPMREAPTYLLSEGATPDEMRALAVKAMRDELTVPWYVDHKVDYLFTSSDGVTMKSITLSPSETYAGMPYTNAITSLYHFLEYYDPETGRLLLSNDGLLDTAVGNQCAGSVIWGLATVASSVAFRTKGLRVTEGMIPLGNYTLSYGDKSNSTEIAKRNGKETMFEAYAEMKLADVFASSEHIMMAIEEAHVVRKNGAIDGDESYVMIQNQEAGARQNTSAYVEEVNGERLHFSGRRELKYTFSKLFEDGYLPLTCAEFLGQKEYELPKAEPDREIRSLEDLSAATVTSNRLLCVFYYRLLDENGKEAFAGKRLTTYTDMNNLKLKNFPLGDLRLSLTSLARSSRLKGDFTLALSCLDCTGTLHDLASFPVSLG